MRDLGSPALRLRIAARLSRPGGVGSRKTFGISSEDSMILKFAARVCSILLLLMFIAGPPALAQTTQSAGTIEGSILDQQGAAIPAAKITIINKGTGQAMSISLSSAGTYNSGPLNPGIYIVRVEAANFRTSETTVTVQVGVITPNTVNLSLGTSSSVVEVTGEETHVNTEQATIQGVLTADQIDNLPVNGRNFLEDVYKRQR